MTDKVQLQNEMLLVLMKTDEELLNNIGEDILDYFTEEVMANSNNKRLKEGYGGLFRDKVHCPNCGFAKFIIWHRIKPNGDDAHSKWFCKNCSTFFKEYNDGTLEEYNEG